mmetsp:Transcript_33859/g.105648  ORF Transcript_33859/g.105648 Transcript_33859/m.105648 type:complete len:290 (+) Transcript_33859:179-1048(+)
MPPRGKKTPHRKARLPAPHLSRARCCSSAPRAPLPMGCATLGTPTANRCCGSRIAPRPWTACGCWRWRTASRRSWRRMGRQRSQCGSLRSILSALRATQREHSSTAPSCGGPARTGSPKSWRSDGLRPSASSRASAWRSTPGRWRTADIGSGTIGSTWTRTRSRTRPRCPMQTPPSATPWRKARMSARTSCGSSSCRSLRTSWSFSGHGFRRPPPMTRGDSHWRSPMSWVLPRTPACRCRRTSRTARVWRRRSVECRRACRRPPWQRRGASGRRSQFCHLGKRTGWTSG